MNDVNQLTPVHRLLFILNNFERLQQAAVVQHTQLVGGGRQAGEIHLGLQVADGENLDHTAVYVKQFGGKSIGRNLVIGYTQPDRASRRVGEEYGLEYDVRIVVHAHGLDFVGLLDTFNDVLVAGLHSLDGDLAHRVGHRAAVTYRRASRRHDAGLAHCA